MQVPANLFMASLLRRNPFNFFY